MTIARICMMIIAALLAQSATECARRSERTEALDTGLFALVRAAGKGKQYVEAKRGAAQ